MIPLDAISIMLLETQSAGNLGSVARVMKNMGLSSLVLVNPQCDIGPEANQLACGADDILLSAVRTESLVEALAPFHLCVGTTSRFVPTFPQVFTPRQLAAQLTEFSPKSRLALLFGPERTGLTNEHVQYCQWLVTIPTHPEFESMNLSHAVAILAYELASGQPQPSLGRPIQYAALNQIESFCQTLQEDLETIGFLKPPDSERLMVTLRNILSRASLEERDVQILRGILRQWHWYAGKLHSQAGDAKSRERPS
ncbi:MAG: RNA methyltransferase [Terriglobia bacterium]